MHARVCERAKSMRNPFSLVIVLWTLRKSEKITPPLGYMHVRHQVGEQKLDVGHVIKKIVSMYCQW